MKFLQSKYTTMALLAAVIILMRGVLFLIQAQLPTLTPALIASVTPGKYDSASYNLPDEVAGYPVIAVVDNAATQFCGTPGMLTLVIQAPQDNVHEFLRDDEAQQALRDAMREIDPTGKAVEYTVVGRGMTREEIQGDYEELESRLEGIGCPAPVNMNQLPPRVTLTPAQNTNTPD